MLLSLHFILNSKGGNFITMARFVRPLNGHRLWNIYYTFQEVIWRLTRFIEIL